MDPVRWAVVLSAALALTGAWPTSRLARWHPYWPVPIMGLALVVGGRDVAVLLGYMPPEIPVFSLVLGVWAAVVVTVVGVVEIGACRRGGADGRIHVAAALLVAGGIALLLHELRLAPADDTAGVASGVLILLAGVLLAALRLLATPAPALRVLWPTALLAGVLVLPPSEPEDPLAEARQEMGIVLAGVARMGARVVRLEEAADSPRFARGPVRAFRIDGNDVQIYLIAHDDDSSPEIHLSPRLRVPPPIGGVSHLHVGPHILVVCITTDPRFARQLDRIVRDLGGHGRRESIGFVMSPSRQPPPIRRLVEVTSMPMLRSLTVPALLLLLSSPLAAQSAPAQVAVSNCLGDWSCGAMRPPLGFVVQGVEDGGRYVILEDGSRWEVEISDRATTASWRAEDFVTVRQISAPREDFEWLLSKRGNSALFAAVRLAGRAPPAQE